MNPEALELQSEKLLGSRLLLATVGQSADDVPVVSCIAVQEDDGVTMPRVGWTVQRNESVHGTNFHPCVNLIYIFSTTYELENIMTHDKNFMLHIKCSLTTGGEFVGSSMTIIYTIIKYVLINKY